MYTIVVNDDNTLDKTIIERIMCRSKLVNAMHFLVKPQYSGFDMSKFTVVLEYRTPVSHTLRTEILVMADDLYRDEFLDYRVPFDTELTAEPGDIELQLTFTDAETQEDGTVIQRVRKTTPTTIKIDPIAPWSDTIPDSALTAVDQRILKLDTVIAQLTTLIQQLNANKADGLVLDGDQLSLTSGGVKVGNSITINNSSTTITSDEMRTVLI